MLQVLVLLTLAATLGLYGAHELAPTRWAGMARTLRRLASVLALPPATIARSHPDLAPRVVRSGQPSVQQTPVPPGEATGAEVPALWAPLEKVLGARRAATLWEARGCWGGLLSCGLAALGQNALTVHGDTAAAGWCYLIAIVLLMGALRYPSVHRPGPSAGMAWGRPSRSSAAATGAPATDSGASLHRAPSAPALHWITRTTGALAVSWARWRKRRARLGWRGATVGLALTVGLAGAATVVLQRNTADPLGGWLWAAALVTLFLTFIGAPAWPDDRVVLPGPENDFFASGLPRVPLRWEAVLVAGMVGLALILRLVNLEYMPGIFGDEGERGMSARAINQGSPAPLFGFGWYGVPNLYFYCVAAMLRLFGDNMVGDRMLSVLSGVAMVVCVYRIARLFWGPRAGLIAGTLLSVSPLALQFSRQATESTPTGALWTGGLLFLCRALRAGRPRDWLSAGLLCGGSLYFYAAGKLVIPLLIVVGLYCLVRWRRGFFQRYALGFVLLGLAFGLTFLPNALVSMQDHWQTFTGRAQETSIFSPQNQALIFGIDGVPYDPAWALQPLARNLSSHPLPWAQVLFAQLRVTTEVINRSGDPTAFYQIQEHRGSMLPPLWATLTLLGLAYAGWKAWDPRFGLVSLWVWVGLLAPALTINTPSVQRLALAWPVLMLFPAVLLDKVSAAAWPLGLTLARRWATVPLAGLLLLFGIGGYHEYFVHYASLCPYCNVTTQARYAQALGQAYRAYQLGVGDGDNFFSYGSTRFVAKGVQGDDLAVPADFFPITDSGGKGAAFIVYSTNRDYLPLIHLFYPGGREQPIKSADGVTRFVSYKVTAAQMARFQTLRATFTSARGRVIRRDEPNLGTMRAAPAPGSTWKPPAGLIYPARVTWQGGLVVPAYGLYTFLLAGARPAQLEIDGHARLAERAWAARTAPGQHRVDLVLARGIHDVRLSGTLGSTRARLTVQWGAAGTVLQPVPATVLYQGPTGGLSGEIWSYTANKLPTTAAPSGGAPPTTRRSDPFFGFREATVTFGAAPSVARWQGTLHAPATGTYTFETASDGPSLVLLDGHGVVNNPASGGTATVSGTLQLAAGSHRVEVRYAWQSGSARLEWYWIPPGGTRSLVPPTVLSPYARSWSRGAVLSPS